MAGDHFYVLGGIAGAILSDVHFTPIAANGTLGAWASTTALPVARSRHASVAYNGFVYVSGGLAASGLLGDVQVARVNNDGTLGAWVATTPLPSARSGHSMVAANGFVYSLGGLTVASSPLINQVAVAQVNPDGTLGAWVITSGFTTARDRHGSVVLNDFIYIAAGQSGSGDLADVQFARITSNGTLGAWVSTTPLSTTRVGLGMAAQGGMLFVTCGTDSASADLVSVEKTQVTATGPVGAWSVSSHAVTTARNGHSMVGHNGRLYVTAGDNAGAALGDVQTATLTTDTGIGGLLGPWAAGTGFPTGRWGHAAVAARGFVYVMSGVDSAPAFLTDVQFARLNPDGSLGAWAATTPMPLGRQLFAATEYNGAIYVSGGNAGSLNDVRRSHINANGTLGPWVFTGTFTTGRYGHATAASNGYFYIFGGASSTNVLLDDVQVARINPDGSLGAFTPVGTFPTARYNFGGFAHNGHLWVVGGALGMYGPMTTDVSAANIRPDGTLTAWVATRPLPTARGYHATIAYDGWLSVSGGYSGSFLSSSDSARILSDGTLEPWASNPPLPRAIGYQTPVADNGFVYLLGGSTGGTSAYNEIPVAPVLGPLAVAKYSRFIDLGMNSIVESITLTGDNGRGTARLATRTSLDAGTFGPMTTLREMPLGQAVPAPSTSRYVWLQVTLDDTRDAPGRSSGLERDLDDVTISLLLANGSSCVDTAECASGECTDGVCCDSACAGACDVCNAPLALGTCTVAGAGSTGSPSCSPYVCNGSTATCPPDCTGSTECVPTAYCTGGGLCVPKSANGVSCSSAASCASGHCIDGVCCDTTCGGACDACNLVGRIGVCSASGLGALGNPSCAPYTCTELSAACFSNCTTDAQCVASAYCSGETCVPKQANGASCSTGSACASGHCVDGVCCSGACGGACDACDVAGFVGTCTFSPVGSPGAPSCSPLSCTGNLTNCPTTCADDSNCLAGQYCELGVCQGRLVDGASCTAAKQCVGDLCIDGVCCNALCDGACDACNLSGSIGTCTVLPMGSPSSCAPFVCAGSAACPTACTDDTNCASGLVCKAGTCVEDGRRYRVGCGCSTGGEVFALLGSLVLFSRRRLHRRLLCR